MDNSPSSFVRTRRSLVLAAVLLAAICVQNHLAQPAQAARPNYLSPEQAAAGWLSLFDGETLFGWRPVGDANWKAEDGAIRASSGEPGFLMTGVDFADYELHLEFKAAPTANSGVFLRTAREPADPAKDCLELNIAPAGNPFPTGSLVGRKKWSRPDAQASLASVPPLIGAKGGGNRPQPFDRTEGWRSFDVIANGANLEVRLDDQSLYTYRDAQPRRGRIGLQFREGEIAFRNIRLRPLNLDPMLTGKDLSGWDASLATDSRFEVTPEGELLVTGGRGQLESKGRYGDFAMQLQCRVDGDGLNSGIFFRSIPGDLMNGYECQISNATEGGDPVKPKDAGTGAIYRRTTARRVVSKDRQWFTQTMVATGPDIAVWVDGYQVTDWTDDRPPHENPRNGLRTAPGTICIQGHDPTTNIRFRNLRIAELPTNGDN